MPVVAFAAAWILTSVVLVALLCCLFEGSRRWQRRAAGTSPVTVGGVTAGPVAAGPVAISAVRIPAGAGRTAEPVRARLSLTG